MCLSVSGYSISARARVVDAVRVRVTWSVVFSEPWATYIARRTSIENSPQSRLRRFTKRS